MSLQRRLRRQEQKKNNGHSAPQNPFQQLHQALGGLKEVQGLGETAKGIQEIGAKLQEANDLVIELGGLRDDLRSALAQAGESQVELGRQRAVFLRFLFQPDLLAGPGNFVEKFLAMETRYRGEYDAMLFLVGLAHWAKEAP